MNSGKSLPITKLMVWEAYKLVRRKGKAAGVDGQSLDDFAEDLENNLYRLWNRMASGSYFPPPVRRVGPLPPVNHGISSLATSARMASTASRCAPVRAACGGSGSPTG